MRAQPRVRVAALEWLDPVYVAGHWTPQLIELAGGEDVLGFPAEPSERMSYEAVAAAEPEVVIVMPCGYGARRAHQEAVAHAEQLATIGARRVVAVDASAYFSRPGPRLIDGLELLAHILHPERVPEIEAEALELRAGPGARRRSLRPPAAAPAAGQANPALVEAEAMIPIATPTALIAAQPARPSARERWRSPKRTASPASRPPMSPPMCAPTETSAA